MTRNTKLESPPSVVAIAAWLYIGYGLLTMVRILIFRGGPPTSVGAGIAWVLVLGYFAFVARSLYIGRNWVRWCLVILWLGALISWPWLSPKMPPWPERSIYYLQIVCSALPAILTFAPTARSWFRPNNSFKPKPLRGSA